MRHRQLLSITFVLACIVGALHQIGSIFYLYWDVYWFDCLMHYLGAVTVGFLVLWVWFVSGLFGRDVPSKKSVMITAIVSVMMVALGWEFFEYVYDITGIDSGKYSLDTFHDLLFGFLGAITVGIAGRVRSFYE